MANGKVKWFDNRRGFGFIVEESGLDVFVHYSSIAGGGYKVLNDGEPVTFDMISGGRGFKAQNVRKADSSQA